MTFQYEPKNLPDFCPDGLGNPTRVGDLIVLTDEFLQPDVSSRFAKQHVGEIGVVLRILQPLGGSRWAPSPNGGVMPMQRVEARFKFAKGARLTTYTDEFIRITDDHTQELQGAVGSEHSGVQSGPGVSGCE